MPAPTFVTEVEGPSWDTTTSPKTTAAFTAAVNDALVVFTGDEGISTLGTPTNTGTAQTWALAQSNTTGSTCNAKVNTAVASAVLSGSTVSNTSTALTWGLALYQFTDTNGVGASAKNTAPTTSGTISITTTAANSAVAVMVWDFNAQDGASRTWATVNGTTPTAGNGFEKTYFRNSLHYTVYGAYYPDVGAAGAKTVGISSPSTSTAYTVMAVEIKGGSGSGPVAGPLPFPPFTAPFVMPTVEPLQLMGDTTASSTSLITLTDTGAGADAMTVTATVPLADTGSGADALTVSAAVPLSDTGAGTDDLTVTATVNLSETGTGADSLAITATVPLTDTGTGVDSLTVNITDYGYVAAPQPFPPFTAPFIQPTAPPLQLLGSTDVAQSTTPNLPDTATATDALTVNATTPLPGDVGTGADALTVSASTALTDTAAGADALTVTAAVPLADTAVSTQNLTVTATVTLADTATVTEGFTVQITGGGLILRITSLEIGTAGGGTVTVTPQTGTSSIQTGSTGGALDVANGAGTGRVDTSQSGGSTLDVT